MPRFRKKPVEVEAAQWFKHGDHADVRYFRCAGTSGACRHCGVQLDDHGWIDTLEGGHIVCPGDFIITGVQGERYPCKPEIFEVTYEPAD